MIKEVLYMQVPVESKRRFKELSERTGKSMAAYVREWIDRDFELLNKGE